MAMVAPLRVRRCRWLLLCLPVFSLAFGGCSKRVLKQPVPPIVDSVQERTLRHQVAAGETLTAIADNYYGDPARSQKILEDNEIFDAERLAPGSMLLLRFGEEAWPEAERRATAMKPYNRGVALLEHNDLTAAEREFRLALDIAPGFSNARYNLALVLGQRGRQEEAEGLLVDLLRDRPAEPDFQFAYGHTLFLQSRFAEAVTVFEQLLAQDPAHRRGTFGLARGLQESGRHQEAIAAWEAYLRLDSQSNWADSARRNLDYLQRESHRR